MLIALNHSGKKRKFQSTVIQRDGGLFKRNFSDKIAVVDKEGKPPAFKVAFQFFDYISKKLPSGLFGSKANPIWRIDDYYSRMA